MPTPPAPPCTSSRSPGARPAWVKTASCAVVKTSGKPPAAGQSSASGTGIAARSCTVASSAWPPPPTTAITRSPSSKRVAPGPSAATSPASSRPGMSCGEPGGAGIGALALQHVGAVQPGGAHPDEHLAGAGLGVRMLLDHDRPVPYGRRTHGSILLPGAQSLTVRSHFGFISCSVGTSLAGSFRGGKSRRIVLTMPASTPSPSRPCGARAGSASRPRL